MDHSPGRPRWRTHPILSGLLLLAALLTTLALAPVPARTRVGATTQALTGWLWATRWCWPLAAALALVALSAPPARRRWPQPARRLPAAVGLFAGLVGLASLATVGRPAVGVVVVGVVVGVGLVTALAVVVPHRVVPRVPDAVLDRLPSDRDRLEVTEANAKLRNDIRTTALQTLVGLAVLAGAVLGFQQLTEDRHQAAADRELTRQGQASERFTQAISQLGSDRREVQLGGIYGLEQIAQQAPDNRLAVAEVLAAYLHRRVPIPAELLAEKTPLVLVGELRSRASDVQAVLTVLGRRQVAQDDPPLDLRRLDLRRADLRRANLSRANLVSTDLSGTDLSGATLRGADLRGARLDFGALRGADLSGTLLAGADLIGADLTSASLRSADLRHGTLILALRRETLATVPGANLSGADLRGADLREANLSEADLSDVHLRGARASRSTQWPKGFNSQGAGVLLGG